MYWSHVGVDTRYGDLSEDFKSERVVRSYGLLSGNFVLPLTAFKTTGGFDENIADRGQDGEFGRQLVKAGIEGCYSERVLGWHIGHSKDPKWETESVIRTIKYIHKKYNLTLKPEHLPKLPEELK